MPPDHERVQLTFVGLLPRFGIAGNFSWGDLGAKRRQKSLLQPSLSLFFLSVCFSFSLFPLSLSLWTPFIASTTSTIQVHQQKKSRQLKSFLKCMIVSCLGNCFLKTNSKEGITWYNIASVCITCTREIRRGGKQPAPSSQHLCTVTGRIMEKKTFQFTGAACLW